MTTLEFQPVVLAAGRGSRMTDISAKVPKALLPVANFPMIFYPLKMLDNHGFEEAIIVVLKSQRAQVDACVRGHVKSDFTKLKSLDYVLVEDEEGGTADALRQIRNKITCDVLVVSCDLVADVPLYRLADVHRAHNSTVTALFSHSTQPAQPDAATPGTKSKRKPERDFIGLEETTDRLLFLSSETDFDESIDIRLSLLNRHPCIDLYSQLTDAHLYILSRSVVDLLPKIEHMTSLKGEVIPYIIKLQCAKKNSENPTTTDEHLQILEGEFDSLFAKAQELSSFGDSPSNGHGNGVRCYGYVMKDRLCLRVNTLLNFCEANRQISKHMKAFFPKGEPPTFIHSTAKITKTQVGPDSMIDRGTVIGEKGSVKKSVIGPLCTVAEKVKITNSIIMDHVKIGEGCNIQNSIVCSNADIGDKSELKDSIVGHTQSVSAMSKFTNEVIIDLDQMMEI